jgi:hypothetical protein
LPLPVLMAANCGSSTKPGAEIRLQNVQLFI